MVIRTLTAPDFDAVLESFNGAFSDYLVPLTATREQLSELLRRRGWVPEASVGAFEDGRMIAFTLNGVDGDRAYDSGTGVIPGFRRQGLARELMLRSIELLRERGCASYVLEVLEANERAAALYRSLGFGERRRFQCWRFESSEARGLRGAEAQTGNVCTDWFDVEPSWQNSAASMARAGDRSVVLGDEDSFAIVFPSNGDLPQLAVRPSARRQTRGARLLREAASVAGKPLRILNIDDRDRGIAAFLEAAGAERTVRQVEMLLPL